MGLVELNYRHRAYQTDNVSHSSPAKSRIP